MIQKLDQIWNQCLNIWDVTVVKQNGTLAHMDYIVLNVKVRISIWHLFGDRVFKEYKMKLVILVLRVILVIIAFPFAIIPAICIAGLIALDNVDTKPAHIMKHVNIIQKRDIK